MRKKITPIIIIVVAVIAFFIAGPFYVINEGEQAVIVQLGKIDRVVTDAGLKIKVPFIDEVVRYPKKIMAWDGEARIVPTAERQFIFVDVVARWRITDPKKFYEAINTVEAAYSKLAEIIDSEVRTVVAENPLRESVRNSNIIMERSGEIDTMGLGDIDTEIISTSVQQNTSHEPILRGRRQLAEEILGR
jgi:membrane protease subunit HflC